MSKQILILISVVASLIIFASKSNAANHRPIFIGKFRFINPRLISKLTKNPSNEVKELQKMIQKPTKSGKKCPKIQFGSKCEFWLT